MKFSYRTFLGYYFLMTTGFFTFSAWGSGRYGLDVVEEKGENTIVYSFSDKMKQKTDNEGMKKLNFDDFVTLGTKYALDENVRGVFNTLLDDISNRAKDLRGFTFNALIPADPFVFTIHKQSFVNVLRTVLTGSDNDRDFKNEGHFDIYFDNHPKATMLMITSPNKNILLVPKYKAPTFHDFAEQASQKDRDDFWVLFFAFLSEYKDQINEIIVNNKNSYEPTLDHLHLRISPNEYFKKKLKPRIVIAKYEDGQITLCKEVNGHIQLGDPIGIDDGKKKDEEKNKNTSNYWLLGGGIAVVAVIGAYWFGSKRSKTLPPTRGKTKRVNKQGELL